MWLPITITGEQVPHSEPYILLKTKHHPKLQLFQPMPTNTKKVWNKPLILFCRTMSMSLKTSFINSCHGIQSLWVLFPVAGRHRLGVYFNPDGNIERQ